MCVLLLSFFGSNADAQDRQPDWLSCLFAEGQAHGAFVIRHHREMMVLTDGYFSMWELSLMKQTNGSTFYSYLRKYPRLGLTYRYSDFGGSQMLGDVHALMAFIGFPVATRQGLQIGFRIGIGPAYVSKKFDRYDNYRNLAIGSQLNAAVSFQLNTRWRLSTRTYFVAAAGLMHISNGTMRTPNFGLNMPGLSAGLGFKLNDQKIHYQNPKVVETRRNQQHFRLQASVASRQIRRHWDEEFTVYIATAAYSWFYSDANQVLLVVDGVYDESTKYQMDEEGRPTNELMNVAKIGVSLGHEWVFSRLSLFMNLGYYVHNYFDADNSVYNKLGVNLDVTRFLYLGITLQAHWAKSEFFSAGLGIKL